ncbi:hypothetical protein, partial [Ornithinimicrobium murale]|uniref:hypothetical protein n=1 Tax=Ornithinimicrobium murale TaxID=1050153 RepID=UPI0013B41082
AIYQALSYRPPAATLEADDDHDWDDTFTGWDQVTLTHTPETGRRTYHPHPDTTRAEADRIRHSTDTAAEEADEPATSTNSDADTSNNNSSHGDNDDDGPTTPWTHDPDAPPPF